MTIAHQPESEITFNDGDITAIEPSVENLDNSETIASMFESMFDEYVEAVRNPGLDYTFDTGRLERTPEGDVQPMYITISNEEIVATKLHDLKTYTKGSITSGLLQFDASALPKEGLVSFDGICKAYIEHGIIRAMDRYDAKFADQPAHISSESTEEDPESTSKFIEVISKAYRGIGAVALRAIEAAPTLFSHPTDIISAFNDQQERIQEAGVEQFYDDRDLLDDPEHAAEVTTTIDLHAMTELDYQTLKFEDVFGK